MTELVYLQLTGNHQQLGEQHGEHLRERIAATTDFYFNDLFGANYEVIQSVGQSNLKIIESFSAHLASELRGIARAAGLATWQIAALNSRTEIWHRINHSASNECTAFSFPESGLLGQNWDWMQPLEPLIVVVELKNPTGANILQMTEPGIIGKIGMNSAGVGLCLNILSGPPCAPAIPIHILLRHLLEQDSLSNIKQQCQKAPLGTWSNILCADDQHASLDIEICGHRAIEVNYDSGPVVHTNHFLSEHSQQTDESFDEQFASSRQRFARGCELATQSSGLDEFKTMLADEDAKPLEICRDYRLIDGNLLGTVASIIMDLPNRIMHISIGNCRDNEWQQIALN